MVLKHIKEIIPSNLRMKTNIMYFYSQLRKLHDQLYVRFWFDSNVLLETAVAGVVRLKS